MNNTYEVGIGGFGNTMTSIRDEPQGDHMVLCHLSVWTPYCILSHFVSVFMNPLLSVIIFKFLEMLLYVYFL